ncbi:hypothetical protein CVT26_003527 [Gymnopilus dilepis]|uniref:Protein kinase domain-containing protein n=1 Tax=Gymnopilus dilepis TaxID=231916 RepID=A0A409WR46_9AGAR|nr:hypothetical protein CVT26_003527 [Gymnopilus dilepis]
MKKSHPKVQTPTPNLCSPGPPPPPPPHRHLMHMASCSDSNSYPSPIGPSEHFWVDMQPFLLHRGYQLRPRYDPDWTPPWRRGVALGEPFLDMGLFEEHLDASEMMLDAIRIHDQRKVVMKKVRTAEEELPIALLLSSPKMRSDTRNCAVPVLDVVLIPGDDEHALLVMPHLLLFDELPFRRVGEFCEMVVQLLEGIEFMYEQNIAHRDACWFNIMMDHSKMVPKGTHFCLPSSHDGLKEGLEWKSRWSVRPVRYFFVDFGISVRCTSKDAKVLGSFAQDKSVPELSNSILYNPFPVDIYELGNVIKKCVENYDDLSLFSGLASHMTSHEPHQRPTAQEAVQLCKQLLQSIEESGLMTRRIWQRNVIYTFSEKLAIASGLYNPMY